MKVNIQRKLQACWRWFNNLTGIRGKVMGIAVLLVLLLGSWITWRSYITTTGVLQHQLEMRGISLARDVAARSVDPVFTNNLYELHRLLRDTLDNNEDIVYLFITDPQGDVLVHSFPSAGVPDGLVGFNKAGGEERFSLATFYSEKGLIHDIAVPIFDGRAGTVRLGMGEDGLRRIVRHMVSSLLLSTTALFIVGILLSYLLASLLVVPLKQLISGTRAVASGDFSVRVPPWSRDELGQLAEAFNFMAGKLAEYKKENLAARSELERKEKLLSQLVEKLIYAQEEERKRIARELHDETSQSLTSMKLGLKVIEDAKDIAKARQVAGELREMLGTTLEEVSALARDLRPSVLDDMGLKAALALYIDKCSTRLDGKIDFHLDGLDGQRFPPYVETAVYRIVQEALTNVMKYARAENISVVVRYREGVLTAIVEDDGIGFCLQEILSGGAVRKGLGLFGMQERASLIGGELEIESSPGEGTTVYLNVPLTGGEYCASQKTHWRDAR